MPDIKAAKPSRAKMGPKFGGDSGNSQKCQKNGNNSMHRTGKIRENNEKIQETGFTTTTTTTRDNNNQQHGKRACFAWWWRSSSSTSFVEYLTQNSSFSGLAREGLGEPVERDSPELYI